MAKTVIITGAGKGIGFQLTKKFLSQPDYNVIVISRDVSALVPLSSDNLYIIKGDLVHNYAYIINEIKNHSSIINYLINNAAMVHNNTIEHTTDQSIAEVMNTNFVVPYKLIRDLTENFVQGAHIVNISSMSGYQGSKKFKGLSLYSATKAALASLSECIAEEWVHKQIYCNCLALGSVDTDMIKISIPGLEPVVTAKQMADYIFEFAINGHKFYNGKILPVSLTTL